MRNCAWVLLLLFAGCQKEPGVSVRPDQLVGTWIDKATAARQKSFIRWTFERDYVSQTEDTVKVCQPVALSSYYKYWIEKEFLVMRYEGITNGLFPVPDRRRRIISLTATEMILDTPRQVFEKCP